MGQKHSTHTHETCPTHALAENALKPLFGSTSFYRFDEILSGSCAAFASLVIISLMFLHATHLSKPNEQIKIMKIACLIPFYSILSVIMIISPKSAVYIAPWLDLVQAFALGSFFLLMCDLVSENITERDVFFAALVISDKKAPGGQGGGLVWYRRRWVMIFQYPVVAILAAVITDITSRWNILPIPQQAILCPSLDIFGHQCLLAMAVLSILRFYFALKVHLAKHKPLAKLLAFKLVVGFTFIIRIVFWILTDAKVLTPTSVLTHADINIAIPNLLICILMVPLSVFFHYAYSCHPYFISNITQTTEVPIRYQGGFLGTKAWIRTINPAGTIRAIIFAFKMGTESQHVEHNWGQQNLINDNVEFEDVGYQYEGGRQNDRQDRRRERRSRY